MFKLIKQIFQKNKNAYIIVVENEKPILVIQSPEEYQKIFGENSKPKEVDNSGKDNSGKDNLNKKADGPADDVFDFAGSEEDLEKLNREIMDLQLSSESGDEITGSSRREAGSARVEDIPLV
ncbi:MAG: hypothetical protein CO002_03690 [Candidatus Portnoybacteria bacterium CG_4_8_14_3_um_filter_44_10]|uniref:Uncharacterized protein n=5 Tax=Candidatus Portnoyibacteriota TaxID=1817913 RepID=A0A2H0KR69_9BACT|nr:MAG: hypothetical protein AUK17_00500 [Parcubacteria group bacterium CG2_30_44_18]PIQ74636.1 MAG: hypothetical protein COV85_00885 [Candidatus Portnoybacteria bacterium CG11_big_fil_rev_8_21_14_0_20_44_10]PIS17149.1 MAG: hypothetical protein COT61_00050 [Candidatus Portnoybacteria bacterium CG09_land_8_20_14_0_10_44_13]PIW75151.1 MAG: hypothetical protein CO002_03690 [Candidatus Portnoybacteria bacterium CG_4_8_14_3_um_filter_44_10]PIZ69816.1 MAG: hypothetical protein COY11_03880 [Candidatus